MDIVSRSPERVASVVWQQSSGAFALTIVAVASFTLEPGVSPLAEDHDEPNLRDGYWDDDLARSLHSASDLSPFKVRADVLLVGHAYAPGGTPVQALTARLVVGEVDKSVVVHADRAWNLDGELLQYGRFVRMPLRWERAGGGAETSNPAGLDASRVDTHGRTAIPNLMRLGVHLSRRGEFVDPIGYGPIAPTWPGRVEKLGRRGASWQHGPWSDAPLPPDLDPLHFNAAPPDQQLDEIRNDERIVLENLHPNHPRLVTNLQGAFPRITVERPGSAAVPVRIRCDTLTIDADRGRCTLAWRGVIPLAHAEERGSVFVELDSLEPKAPRVERAPGGDIPRVGSRARRKPAATVEVSQVQRATLPFAPAVAPSEVQLPPPSERPRRRGVDSTIEVAVEDLRAALPFTAPSEPVRAPPAPAVVAPYAMPSAPPAMLGTPPPLFARAFEPERAAPPPPPAPPLPVTLPVPPASPSSPSTSLSSPSLSLPSPSPSPSLSSPSLSSSSPSAAPREPPAHAVPAAAPAASQAQRGQPVQQSASALAWEQQLQSHPLGRCAAITASIDRRPADRAVVIENHHLTEERWTALHEHWASTLRAETQRGKSTLLNAHDDAYVAELEAGRGPITLEEYARITIASERGREAEALTKLDLPIEASQPIQRVWLRRVAKDESLLARARLAFEAAEEEEDT